VVVSSSTTSQRTVASEVSKSPSLQKSSTNYGRALKGLALALLPLSSGAAAFAGRASNTPGNIPESRGLRLPFLGNPSSSRENTGRALNEILTPGEGNDIGFGQTYGVGFSGIIDQTKADIFQPGFDAIQFTLTTDANSVRAIEGGFECPEGSGLPASDCASLNEGQIHALRADIGGSDQTVRILGPGQYRLELSRDGNSGDTSGTIRADLLPRLTTVQNQTPPDQSSPLNTGWAVFPGETLENQNLDRLNACYSTYLCESQPMRLEVKGDKEVLENLGRYFSSAPRRSDDNLLVALSGGDANTLIFDESAGTEVGADGRLIGTFYNDFEGQAGQNDFCLTYGRFGNDFSEQAEQMTVNVSVKRLDTSKECDEEAFFSQPVPTGSPTTSAPTASPIAPTPRPTDSPTASPGTPQPTPAPVTPQPGTPSPTASPVSPTDSPTAPPVTTPSPTASPVATPGPTTTPVTPQPTPPPVSTPPPQPKPDEPKGGGGSKGGAIGGGIGGGLGALLLAAATGLGGYQYRSRQIERAAAEAEQDQSQGPGGQSELGDLESGLGSNVELGSEDYDTDELELVEISLSDSDDENDQEGINVQLAGLNQSQGSQSQASQRSQSTNNSLDYFNNRV